MYVYLMYSYIRYVYIFDMYNMHEMYGMQQCMKQCIKAVYVLRTCGLDMWSRWYRHVVLTCGVDGIDMW